MVARNIDADGRRVSAQDGIFRRFLAWWQWTLSALLNRLTAAARAGARFVAEEVSGAPRKHFALRSPAIAWTGGLSLLVGALGTVALSPEGIARSVALSAAAMILVWGGLRWLLLRVVGNELLPTDSRAIRGAWALGSMAWVVGVTPELRAVAWAVSAAVTWLVLERLGGARRKVAICVGIAWGSQAFVVLGSWLARNALVAFLAARG